MSSAYVEISDIVKGYDWSCEIEFDAPLFSPATTIEGQIRRVSLDEGAIGSLSTTAGTIAIIDAATIAITIPGAMSRDWRAIRVRLDLIRTDGPSPEHLGIELDIAAIQPQTRTIS